VHDDCHLYFALEFCSIAHVKADGYKAARGSLPPHPSPLVKISRKHATLPPPTVPHSHVGSSLLAKRRTGPGRPGEGGAKIREQSCCQIPQSGRPSNGCAPRDLCSFGSGRRLLAPVCLPAEKYAPAFDSTVNSIGGFYCRCSVHSVQLSGDTH
jgi:hypothetical protein